MNQQDINDALASIPRILEERGLRGVYNVTGNRVRIVIGTDGEPGFKVITFDAAKMVRATVTAALILAGPEVHADPDGTIPAAPFENIPTTEPAADPAPKRKGWRRGKGE